MRLEKLKVGDRIRYKKYYNSSEFDVEEKTIGYISDNYILVSDVIDSLGNRILKENIICKLEEIPFIPFSIGTTAGQQNCDICNTTSNFSGGGVCYKYPWRCDKCINGHGEIKKEYKEIPIEKESKPEIFCECGKCKWSKNSNEIKSYKFDLRLYDVQVEREYFSGRVRTKINGFCENDRVKFSFEGLPGKEWMDLTKTYTVEVREKE